MDHGAAARRPRVAFDTSACHGSACAIRFNCTAVMVSGILAPPPSTKPMLLTTPMGSERANTPSSVSVQSHATPIFRSTAPHNVCPKRRPYSSHSPDTTVPRCSKSVASCGDRSVERSIIGQEEMIQGWSCIRCPCWWVCEQFHTNVAFDTSYRVRELPRRTCEITRLPRHQ